MLHQFSNFVSRALCGVIFVQCLNQCVTLQLIDDYVNNELYLGMETAFPNTSIKDCVWRRTSDGNCSKNISLILYVDNKREVYNLSDKNWLQKSSWNPYKATVVLVHGYASGDDDIPIQVLKGAYAAHGGYNLFLVEYSQLTRPPCYVSSLNNVQYISRCVAKYLNDLQRKGVTMESCIGHSLGAIICGALKKYLQFELNKIIGLDPALPLIYGDLRLQQSSAKSVHVLQTNAGGLGDVGSVGHVNVCVNGGLIQPYCLNARNPNLCSHIWAVCYMAQSLFEDRPLIARSCSTYCPKAGIFQYFRSNSSETTPTTTITNTTITRTISKIQEQFRKFRNNFENPTKISKIQEQFRKSKNNFENPKTVEQLQHTTSATDCTPVTLFSKYNVGQAMDQDDDAEHEQPTDRGREFSMLKRSSIDRLSGRKLNRDEGNKQTKYEDEMIRSHNYTASSGRNEIVLEISMLKKEAIELPQSKNICNKLTDIQYKIESLRISENEIESFVDFPLQLNAVRYCADDSTVRDCADNSTVLNLNDLIAEGENVISGNLSTAQPPEDFQFTKSQRVLSLNLRDEFTAPPAADFQFTKSQQILSVNLRNAINLVGGPFIPTTSKVGEIVQNFLDANSSLHLAKNASVPSTNENTFRARTVPKRATVGNNNAFRPPTVQDSSTWFLTNLKSFDESSRVEYSEGSNVFLFNDNVKALLNLQKNLIQKHCSQYIVDGETSIEDIMNSMYKYFDCYVLNSNVNRLRMVSCETNIPTSILEAMLVDMNPKGVCTVVNKFYDECDSDAHKEFYLGLSVNLPGRMSNQKTKAKPETIEKILENCAHDVAPFLEMVGLIFLKKLIAQSNGKHKMKNCSPGFDAVSYAQAHLSKGGLYMYCCNEKLEQIDDYEIEYSNLNGQSCAGSFKELEKNSKSFHNKKNLKCNDCNFVASLPETLEKHNLSDHKLLGCECKHCLHDGTLSEIIKHLSGTQCIDIDLRKKIQKKSAGSKIFDYVNHVIVPEALQSLLSRYLKLCEINCQDNKLRRTYEDTIVSIFSPSKHNPGRRNGNKFSIFCHKGDCENGLEGRPYLWYLCTRWIMFKLSPLPGHDNIYVMTKEYCWPWQMDITNEMIEIVANVTKMNLQPNPDVIPLCKSGENIFSLKEVLVATGRRLKMAYRSEYKKYPEYLM